MRILHILPHLSKGGAERQFGYLAPELVRMGHEVHVAYLAEGPGRPELPGVVLHQLKSRSNYSPFLSWKLARLIRRIKPDIVHTWILQMDILGGLAAKLGGVPWVLREPSSVLRYQPTWKNRLRILVGSGASAIVSNSQGGDKYWKKRLPDGRRYIVSNALPLGEIDKTVAALPPGMVKSEAPIVLCVGRIVEHKGMGALLESLTRVRLQQNALGVLCGEGPDRSKLEELKHRLGLDANVYFTGHILASSAWALMKKASVFVSLSAYEGCPNAVIEAMACGCPLILSDIPAHREIVNENYAIFVEPSNIQQVADAIIQALRDTDASKNRALAAKQKSQEWSIPKMAQHYETVYRDSIRGYREA